MGFFSDFKNKLSLKVGIERLMIDVLERHREIHPAFAKEITNSAVSWAVSNGFAKDLRGRRMTTAFMSLCAMIEARFIESPIGMKHVMLDMHRSLIEVAEGSEHSISKDAIEFQWACYLQHLKELNPPK